MKKKHNFNSILVFPINNLNNHKNKYIYTNQLIPLEWELLLMSDGSFTQNLNSLTNQKSTINIVYESYYTKLKKKKKIRKIFMKNYYNKNLAFAKSLLYKHKICSFEQDLPIGQLLIESSIDIYKDIHEIYYGYSAYLRDVFQDDNPVWGRKYTLYYYSKPLITIKEFFSPQLIDFFNTYQAFQ